MAHGVASFIVYHRVPCRDYSIATVETLITVSRLSRPVVVVGVVPCEEEDDPKSEYDV